MHAYERWIVRRYLSNALKTRRLASPPRIDSDIAEWVASFGGSIGVPALELPLEPRRRGQVLASSERNAAWRVWRARAIEAAEIAAPALSPLQRRVEWLAEACSLTAAQAWTIGLLARIADVGAVSALVASVNERLGFDFDAPRLLELRPFLDARFERGDLADEEQLLRLGLIESRDALRLSGVVHRVLSLEKIEAEKVSDLLLGKPATASLSWEDFAHLGEVRDIAARLVEAYGGSTGGVQQGVNLLFYGLSGAGKTEFAKTLGARLGFSVQFAGEANDQHAEPNRRERIAALIIANAIGGVARKTIVIVDEADDLFLGVDESDPESRRGSKVFMNRLIERAAAPTIWIANDIERLGSAVVRRMNLVIRFAKPALSVRKAIVRRVAGAVGFHLDESAIADLARHSAPPALIENAIRTAAAMNGAAEDARLVLERGLQALGMRPGRAAHALIAFDPALSAADIDLALLADQVAASRSRALSFCFSGPSGSGKSAYARYLAERLDLEVMEKRFSELTSAFLGESEKAIAAAFEEAADLHAFLIVDEADSLLRDRREARHSWEVTIVNEMLTWMERHPHPFVCTTNAPDLLDTAAMRRFLFKVGFLPMRSDQVVRAYRRAFQAEPLPAVLRMDTLTPADIFAVARRAELADVRDSATLAGWLRNEVTMRGGEPRRKIGF